MEGKICDRCKLNLDPGAAHLVVQVCILELQNRIMALREINGKMARKGIVDTQTIVGLERALYALCDRDAKNGVLVLTKTEWDAVPAGAHVDADMTEKGLELRCVVDVPKVEAKPS